MALYEMHQDTISPIHSTTFADLGLRERGDLQRLLRSKIDIVAPDCLVIAEEFGHWDDSRRRIDLLAIDRDANLVIIELKRTDTGGHMELQALRYAAMVSTMTAEQATEAFRRYLQSIGEDPDSAAQRITEYLGWDEIDDDLFGQDVRIVLVSAEFSKELTTTVMWLNERTLDIRCVRLQPHRDGDRVLVDIQQVIPLPEAAEYQVRVRKKHVRERVSRQSDGRDYTRFDVVSGSETHNNLPKRRAMLVIVIALCKHGATPDQIQNLITWRGKHLFVKQIGRLNSDEMRSALAQEKANGTMNRDPKRYFCWDDADLIHIDSGTYAFSNQWGRRTEEAMTILINAFPDADVRFERSETD